MGRLRVALLLATVVSVNAAYTVLIPFVPELQQRIGASPWLIGLAFTLFAAGKLLAQPIGGLLVDRRGPRAVAVLALLVVAVGTATTALADNGGVLLLGRVAWGLGEGVLTPALYAGMTYLCERDQLSSVRVMGLFGTAAVAGFLVGPLVTGLASGLGFRTLFLLGAGVTVLSALMIAWALRGARGAVKSSEPEAAPEVASGDGSRWWVGVLMFGSLDLVTNVTYSALEPVLPLHLAAGAPDRARSAISLVFVLGLAVFGVIVWLFGRAGERVGLTRLVRVGLVCSAIGVAGLTASAWLPVVAAWFALVMVGQSALYLAARRGVIELRAGLAGHGRAFGLFGATSDLGNMIGPSIGVALYGWTGQTAFLVLAVPSVVLLVVLLGLAARRATVGVRGSG
jgi:MFS family permease